MPSPIPSSSDTPTGIAHTDARADARPGAIPWQLHFRRLAARVGLDRERRLLVIAALTGIIVALVALGFILPIYWVERQLVSMGATNHTTGLLIIGVGPILGALLCGAVIASMKVQIKAHGISSVLYAIHRKRAQLPLKLALRTWLGASATIISGGSAGPEGPIVTIGATFASAMGRLLRLDPARTTTLVGCGSAAGLAAVFNAPLTGIFFTLEVILRELSLRTFMPIVIAAVFAAATVQSVRGTSAPLFGDAAESASVQSNLLSIASLPALALLGIVCGGVSVAFVRALQSSEHAFARLRTSSAMKPALGACMLVALGIAYVTLTPNAVPSLSAGEVTDASLTPPFYGSGYSVARSVMNPSLYLPANLLPLAALLCVLAMMKVIATCLTLGSGSIGGLFAPSLLIGALLGGSFGSCMTGIPVLGAIAPATCALAGMAGVVAATTHAPIAGAMLVYELTQEPKILLPVVLVAACATVTCRLFERHSLYTAELASLGVRLGSPTDASALRQLRVHDAGLVDAITVRAADPATRLVELSQSTRSEHFVALTPEGGFGGIVSSEDLKHALVHIASLPALNVSDLFAQRVKPLRRDESLEHAVDAFTHADVDSLPVIDHAGIFLGLVTRKSVMRCWRKALERDA
ncbi:MAG: CBS domain-containing protein [Phycisphaerales bacterium]|nr:CBS domain-containing protein [Phycisphaerales bacterium]